MDARNRSRLPFTKSLTFALCALVCAAWSTTGEAISPDKTGVNKPKKSSASGSDHIYFPDTARPFYDYQDTGAFASHPMVIPPTVPILTQPVYLYVESPAPEVIQAPMPILDHKAMEQRMIQQKEERVVPTPSSRD